MTTSLNLSSQVTEVDLLPSQATKVDHLLVVPLYSIGSSGNEIMPSIGTDDSEDYYSEEDVNLLTEIHCWIFAEMFALFENPSKGQVQVFLSILGKYIPQLKGLGIDVGPLERVVELCKSNRFFGCCQNIPIFGSYTEEKKRISDGEGELKEADKKEIFETTSTKEKPDLAFKWKRTNDGTTWVRLIVSTPMTEDQWIQTVEEWKSDGFKFHDYFIKSIDGNDIHSSDNIGDLLYGFIQNEMDLNEMLRDRITGAIEWFMQVYGGKDKLV